MPRPQKTLRVVLSGRSDANIRFADLCALLMHLGFDMRVRGSHHAFRHPAVVERVNLQAQGSMAKRYQVRQVRRILLRYALTGSEDTDNA